MKWLILGVVVLLVVGGAAAYLLTRDGGQGNGQPPAGNGQSTTIGTIQVPEGPKIKVVFEKPAGLKATWEKLGMYDAFQLHIVGTLTNVSGQTVKFSEIAFLLDGRQVDYLPGRSLNPGEEMKIMKGFPYYSEDARVLVIKVRDFQVVGDRTTPTPTPTVTKTPTITPTSPTLEEKLVFIETPKNPKSPAEVIAAFYFLLNKNEVEKARELCTSDYSTGTPLEEYAYYLKGDPLVRLEITIEPLWIKAYFTSGKKTEFTVMLRQEGGRWKMYAF